MTYETLRERWGEGSFEVLLYIIHVMTPKHLRETIIKILITFQKQNKKDHILLKLHKPLDFDYIEYFYKISPLKMIIRNL